MANIPLSKENPLQIDAIENDGYISFRVIEISGRRYLLMPKGLELSRVNADIYILLNHEDKPSES